MEAGGIDYIRNPWLGQFSMFGGVQNARYFANDIWKCIYSSKCWRLFPRILMERHHLFSFGGKPLPASIPIQFVEAFVWHVWIILPSNYQYMLYRHIQYKPRQIPKLFLISSCSCLCAIYWSHVLSWEWRCIWSSADRRCSNYIWVINILLPTKAQFILHNWR